MGASDRGTAGLALRTISVSADGMLPSDTDPIAIPHPFSSGLSKGGLLRQIDGCTADSSWQNQGKI